MALISLDDYQKLQDRHELQKSGIASRVAEFKNALQRILNNESLDAELQMMLYHQIFSRYLILNEKLNEPTTVLVKQEARNESPDMVADTQEMKDYPNSDEETQEDWVSKVFTDLPRGYRKKAEILVDYLNDASEFEVNSRGEVVLNGERIPDTHIIDLVHDIVRNRQKRPPPHGHGPFLKFLKGLNVPKESFGNRQRWKEVNNLNDSMSSVRFDKATPDTKRQNGENGSTLKKSFKRPKYVEW
jgi:hypothetical protein